MIFTLVLDIRKRAEALGGVVQLDLGSLGLLIEAIPAVFYDRSCVLWNALVHAVDLSGDLDSRILLAERLSVGNLINILYAKQAINRNFGDILDDLVSFGDLSIQWLIRTLIRRYV